MRAETYPLEAKASVAAGAPFSSNNFTQKTVGITGTFVGSIDVEGSIDGTSWTKIQTVAGTDSPALVAVNGLTVMVRLNTTAWTSGAVVGSFAGLNTRAQ